MPAMEDIQSRWSWPTQTQKNSFCSKHELATTLPTDLAPSFVDDTLHLWVASNLHQTPRLFVDFPQATQGQS